MFLMNFLLGTPDFLDRLLSGFVLMVFLFFGMCFLVLLILHCVFSGKLRRNPHFNRGHVIRTGIFSFLCSIPLAFSIYGLACFATPPKDFKDGTEVIYDCGHYKTEDGKVWLNPSDYAPILDDYSPYYTGKCYAYKPDGMLSKSQWRTWYAFKNSNGQQMLYRSGTIYFYRDMTEIESYYEENSSWYAGSEPFVNTQNTDIQGILSCQNLPSVEFSGTVVTFRKITDDGFFSIRKVKVGKMNDSYYVLHYAEEYASLLPDSYVTDDIRGLFAAAE